MSGEQLAFILSWCSFSFKNFLSLLIFNRFRILIWQHFCHHIVVLIMLPHIYGFDTIQCHSVTKIGLKNARISTSFFFFFSFHVSWCCHGFQVILNVILNLFGVLFAIAAIVLYSIDIAVRDLWWLCDDDYRFQYQTPSPEEESLQEKCLQGKALLLVSLISEKTSTTCCLDNCMRSFTIWRAP